MLNHLIRGLLFHYKKVSFCFNFIWKGCFKKMHHLFFRVRANDVNSTKSQPKIFIWRINKMTSDKRWQAKFSGIVLRWKQFLSFKNCRSVSICSVLNRSNRDSTVYYRLIFCAFSWPNMVKWRNSGIINYYYCYCNTFLLFCFGSKHGIDLSKAIQVLSLYLKQVKKLFWTETPMYEVWHL